MVLQKGGNLRKQRETAMSIRAAVRTKEDIYHAFLPVLRH